MKVMVVTPYFYPKGGGLENYALNIVTQLKKQGHEVFVVTSNHVDKQRVEETLMGIRIIRLPIMIKFSNTPFSPAWFFQLKKIIKNEKPDIINAHSPVPGLSDMAILASKKTPTVLTYHAATLRKKGSIVFNVVARAYEIVQIPTLHKARSIVAVSDYVKECLPKRYQKKTSVIYNAVNPNDIPRQITKRNFQQVVFVASLAQTHSWKGLKEIIDAVAIARQIDNKITLSVLGDGDMRLQYEAQAEQLGIKNAVTFHGNVTGEKKYKLIQASSLMLVYPTSKNDAFPTVMVEAWACGVPVLAANIGALTAIMKSVEGGELVEANNPELLAASINRLLNNQAQQKVYSKNGLEGIYVSYNWDSVAANTEALFISLVNRRIYYISTFVVEDNLAPSIHIKEVCNNLKSMGYDVTLMSPGLLSPEKNDFMFKKIRAPHFVFPITYQIVLLFRLMIISIRLRPALLYVRQEPLMLAPALVSKALRLSLITEVNGDIEAEVINDNRLPIKAFWTKTNFFHRVQKLSLRESNAVITITQGLAEVLITRYNLGRDKVKVIENGVNTAIMKPLPKPKNTKFVIGYVGGLQAWQGLGYIVDAMKKLRSKVNSSFELHIYGEGSESDTLEKQIKDLGLTKSVVLKGSIPHQKVNETINSFDICVAYYTKDREGINSPFKVYEYLACGKPTIVSDVKGIGDVFKTATAVIPAENATALSRKIVELSVDKTEYDRLAKRAVAFINDSHTWTDVAKKIDNVIKSVV